jgi:hypothetical protein
MDHHSGPRLSLWTAGTVQLCTSFTPVPRNVQAARPTLTAVFEREHFFRG